MQQAIQNADIKMAEKLWCWAKAKMTPADLKNELFLRHNWEGLNAWHSVVKRGRMKMLVKMWDWAK